MFSESHYDSRNLANAPKKPTTYSSEWLAVMGMIKCSLTYSILGNRRVQRRTHAPEEHPEIQEDVHVADSKIAAKKINFSLNNLKGKKKKTHSVVHPLQTNTN